MIFEALFLAFSLGSESAERKTAAIKAKSMMNDQETMRREFFAKSRKWQEERHFMCDFCEKFDFGTASCVVDQYGASIVMAGGSYRFPEYQQFLFCPKCGASRLKKNILPPMEERKFPPHNQPQPFILN